MGGALFSARYAIDPHFRWREERIAYEAEVAYLLAAGYPIRREDLVADVMAPMYRGMVSREEAERWAAGLVPPPR